MESGLSQTGRGQHALIVVNSRPSTLLSFARNGWYIRFICPSPFVPGHDVPNRLLRLLRKPARGSSISEEFEGGLQVQTSTTDGIVTSRCNSSVTCSRPSLFSILA